MAMSFVRGDAGRPRGHALIAFRRSPGSDDAYVTYAVVLPIVVDPMKYLPPAFATQFQGLAGSMQNLDAVPMPPVPEAMSIAVAVGLAERRDDDLVDAGLTDGSPLGLMQQAQQAVREYAEAYRTAGISGTVVPRGASELEPASAMATEPADDDSFRWLMMTERGRIDEMTRLVGRVRDAVTGGSRAELDAVHGTLVRLASTLPLKYRAGELAIGATRDGAEGTRLAELYLDRCYKLCSEQYEGLADIDRAIAELEAGP
jgi:hypothetical protein